jgi:rfaE bifunctional protein nucleotidyltransferase chain/domain
MHVASQSPNAANNRLCRHGRRYHARALTGCAPVSFMIELTVTTMNTNFDNKICPPNTLVSRAAQLARPLVFTNGVFDILHRGHATYLAQSRELGASLIVALNTDDSVRRLGKGPDRPINNLEDRMALVAALQSVNLVTWFDDDTPLDAIVACKPDVLVKGGDWPAEQIVGAKEVLGWNGSVRSIPF